MAVKLARPINYKSVANINAHDFANTMQDLKVNKKFAVALSGGPDSLALTLLSEQYAKEFGLKFITIGVDHSLRPEAKNEIKWVEKLMKRKKIKFISLKLKGKQSNSNIMANAREKRYELLTQYCKKSKIPYLLTAHHLDDEIENFLMRLIRGSGIKGLSSSKRLFKYGKSGIYIVRPLLGFSKKALIKYLSLKKQSYIVDPTNKDSKFDRSRIRELTNKLIEEGLSKSRFANVLNNLKKAEIAIQNSLSNYGKNLIKISDKSSLVINIKEFIDIPEEIKFRLLSKIIEYVSGQKKKPRAKSIINLMTMINQNEFKSITLHDCIFIKEGNTFRVKLEEGRGKETKKKRQFIDFSKKGLSVFLSN